MIDINLFDKFKDEYLALLKERMGKELSADDMYLAENYSIIDSIQQDIKNLNLSIELFFKAKRNHDELAMRAALLYISTFMTGVGGVFYQTSEDVDRFTRIPDNATFPEDYKIPEHYNFPLK